MKIKRALAAVCVLAVILSAAAGGVTTTRAETVQSEQNSALEMQNVHEDQIKEHGFVKDCIVWDITELDKEENDRIVYGYTVRASKGGEVVASATYYDNFVEYRRFFYEKNLDFGEYAFEICSFDRNGNSGEFSQPITVEYKPTLETPSDVRRSEDGQYILWDCVEGAERYNYRIKKGSELWYESYLNAGTDSSGSFSIWISDYLGLNGDYTFEFQTMDKNYNVSAWSEPVSVTYTEPEYVEPDELPKLEAPENVRLDESGNNILWDAVEGADSYEIVVSSMTDYNDNWVSCYEYVYEGVTQYDNWKSLMCPFSKGKYEIIVYARGDGFNDSDWSETLEADFQPIRDESIELPEKVWLEGNYLCWREWEAGDLLDKTYWTNFSLYSEDGELIYDVGFDYTTAYDRYIYEMIFPAGAYEAEIFVVDQNGNYNSKRYPVEINTVPDESVWVPRLHCKSSFLWDWDRLRYDDTRFFWMRLKEESGTVVSLWKTWDSVNWLGELQDGKYILEVCAVEYGDNGYKIGNWTGVSFSEHRGNRFSEENESTSDVVQAPEAAGIPEEDRITSITLNPSVILKDKKHGNEFDLSQIKIKANEIYDEEGLKRAEEALGKKIVGNKHYNLLDLTLWEGDRDISNGYEGLVKVIIPLPKGHRDKTFSCYRLTEVGGQMIKEVIEGEQTEDSYIIYLEHFSQYALVADGGEEDAKGDGEWEYELLEDGTAEITAYKGNESELEIPESIDGVSVTRIKDHVFSGYSGLTSVTIPDSVTSIGDGAFEKCGGLTSVTIPDSVTSIGVFAFSFCGGLTSVTIPDSMTSIGNGLFYDCGSLTSVTIPSGVTSIGDYAFERCGGLTSVAIPDSVTSIGICAFCHCGSLTSVTIPKGVTSIGANAFYECGLTSVTIPDSVTSIDVRAFGYMQEGSNYVKIPDFTICGRPDTAAEAYAKENNFIFTEIKEEAGEAPTEKPSDDMDYSDVASGSGIPGTFIAVFLLAGLAVMAAGAVVAAKAFKASDESRE